MIKNYLTFLKDGLLFIFFLLLGNASIEILYQLIGLREATSFLPFTLTSMHIIEFFFGSIGAYICWSILMKYQRKDYAQ